MMTCPLHLTAERADTWTDMGVCSYCGSISGAEAMLLVEAGAQVWPTDTNALMRVGPAKRSVSFHHLSLDQQVRLAELIMTDKVNFGPPGYFPRRPFFMEV